MRETLERLIMQANAAGFDLGHLLDMVRAEAIRQALDASKGNQCAAARRLSGNLIQPMHRNTLSRWMIALRIPRKHERMARGRSK